MSSLAVDYRYLYPFPSVVCVADSRPQLSLATFTEQDSNPYFFEGRLLAPYLTARLLQDLSAYVRTRFFMQINPLLLDPVVTSHGDFIRFEAFSGCCSVYLRLDLPPQSLAGETTGCGTTNVDFNPPMLAALGRIGRTDDLNLSVGADELTISRNGTAVVEKKVRLPLRWLKGFTAVTNYSQTLQPTLRVDAVHAMRFLKSLPRSVDNKARWWVASAGKSLRSSTRPAPGTVQAGGLNRLRILENNVAQCQQLTVYGHPDVDASGWELDFGDMRFSLIMTHDVWRGFSGEGQGLFEMARTPSESLLTRVSAGLQWQSVLDPAELVGPRLNRDQVMQGFDCLASLGKVGYDMHAGQYFHRQLPYEVDYVSTLQPRLKDARKIVTGGGVTICERNQQEDLITLAIASTDVIHSVQLTDTTFKCTCPWFAKHGMRRGPCKHVLAAYLTVSTL